MPSSETPRLVSVCICTFRRYEGIKKALISVLTQEIPVGWDLEVVVVDNDANSDIATMIQEVFNQSGAHLARALYLIEPQSGVTFARNRCLAEARGELIAFIDDDEEAKPLWLSRMITQILTDSADAVFGPICVEYATKTEPWLVACGIHQRLRFPSGAQIGWGDSRTGNVLFRSALLQKVKQFDARFSRIGGEDSFFFAQAAKQGAKLVWCNEAEVVEHVPAERMSKKWVAQRAFLEGRTYACLRAKLNGVFSLILLIFKGFLAVLVYFPMAFTYWAVGNSKHMYCLRKAFGGLGKLAFWYRGGVYAASTKK